MSRDNRRSRPVVPSGFNGYSPQSLRLVIYLCVVPSCTVPDGEIVGVLSERDFVRGFAEKGAAIMDVKVTDLITKDVLTAGLADDSSAILRKLWINNVRHMPVVQDGALVGILSVRDLMKSLTQEDGTRAQDILLDVLREGRYYPGA